MAKQKPLTKTIEILRDDPELIGLFQYNEFSEDVELTRRTDIVRESEEGKFLIDKNFSELRYYMSYTHDHEPSKSITAESCFIASREKVYHPIKRYIEKERWDGKHRLDTWLIDATGCEDNVYTRAAGRRFLIAGVNRIYNPGCKFDHMMIFEGEQGIGKSTLVEELMPESFLDTSFNNKDKDLIDLIRRFFLIEIGELSGMDKKDLNWTKAFIVRKVDWIRLPYASKPEEFRRRCLLFGTHNPSGDNTYLRDDTGNRRFWPIECVKADVEYLRENRHQLWAEAYEGYKRKEKYYIDRSDEGIIEILESMHEDRQIEDPDLNKLRAWLRGKTETTKEDVMFNCLGYNPKTPREKLSTSTIVGIMLKKAGWIKGKKIYKGKYVPAESPLTNNESNKQEGITWD